MDAVVGLIGSRFGRSEPRAGSVPMCAGCWRGWSARTAGRWPSTPGRCPRTGCSGCCGPRTGTSTGSATTCAATSGRRASATPPARVAGVFIVDDTGFLKKGSRSAGVQRQYSGTAGKIENCQIGVFLAYASGRGHALIDRELYLPTPGPRTRTGARRRGSPRRSEFATKPELAVRMLERVHAAGVLRGWVTADEAYGQNPACRAWLAAPQVPYRAGHPQRRPADLPGRAPRARPRCWPPSPASTPTAGSTRRVGAAQSGLRRARPAGLRLDRGRARPGRAARRVGALAAGPPQSSPAEGKTVRSWPSTAAPAPPPPRCAS